MKLDIDANNAYDYIHRAATIQAVIHEIQLIKTTDQIEKMALEIAVKKLNERRINLYYNGMILLNDQGNVKITGEQSSDPSPS